MTHTQTQPFKVKDLQEVWCPVSVRKHEDPADPKPDVEPQSIQFCREAPLPQCVHGDIPLVLGIRVVINKLYTYAVQIYEKGG